MSHPPEPVLEDKDADNGHDDGDLQHTHLGSGITSNVRTGSASATWKSQPSEGTTSMFPSPTTTTTSPYLLPLSTSIAIFIFPPSLTAATSPSYMPTYRALPDGSLLTPLYIEDLISSNARLFGGSALLTLFIINVWIAATFLRRAQLSSIKDKSLFYLLLASQVMGPAAFTSLLVPYFSRWANCTVVNIIAFIATALSYALLITAILGLKAYRCLNRSRLVVVALAFFQLLIFVLFSLDLPNIRSDRLLSGACNTTGNIKYTPLAVILTVLEAFLIGLCFLYAVWKSSLYPVAQGRLSIALSVAPSPESGLSPMRAAAEDEIIRRGWWDYVPQAPAPTLAQPLTPAPSIRRLRASLRNTFSPVTPTALREVGEKSPRQSAMRKLEGEASPYASVRSNIGPLEGSPLPAPTNNEGPTKQERQPYEDTSKDLGMVQMRAVIMNELISAGCIATSNIATAVLTAMGTRDGKLEFGTSMRLGVIWAFNSLLIMRSFSSVVKRHEKDAIVQQYHPPSTMVPWQRRRRDAVAAFQPHGGVRTSTRTLAPSGDHTMRQSNTGATLTSRWRDSYSWEIGSTSGYSSVGQQRDKWSGTAIESETDTASIRRREGLREWALERDARRASSSAAAATPSLAPLGLVKDNPFADAEAVHGDGKRGVEDLGRTFQLISSPKPDAERGIIVREPTARGWRRSGVTDLTGSRWKSGGPTLPPSRHSSNRSMAEPPPPPPPPSPPETMERRPSVASSQVSVEHSADEPLLSPRTCTRD